MMQINSSVNVVAPGRGADRPATEKPSIEAPAAETRVREAADPVKNQPAEASTARVVPSSNQSERRVASEEVFNFDESSSNATASSRRSDETQESPRSSAEAPPREASNAVESRFSSDAESRVGTQLDVRA